MEQYSLAQEFVNLMAKALQILVSVSREDLYTLNAMKDYSAIGNDVKQKIDTPTIESAQQLLERIRSILSIAQSCTNPDRLLYAKALCQYLDQLIGATLILVPSYSNGERDFIDSLSTLKPYGTSVIWGNCCGAVCDDSPQMHTQRTIGGCSYAGIDCPNRFGTIANCNFHCGASSVCLFVVNIPTAVSQGKISPGSIPKIEHINN